MNYQKSNKFLQQALKSIPLASQTFSKSITQYPQGAAPLFIKKGNGSKVWDIDGNEYIDFVNSLAAITLGYCNKDVDNAIIQQLKNGILFSLPHKLETEVAEKLIKLIPCAQKVRFGKNGTDATSAAIRLARAYTNKEHIAVCGYHGWQDWYIGSTSRDLGVPKGVKVLTHKFEYNNIKSLEKLLQNNQFAAVIMEPMNVEYPKNNFLEKVRELTKKYNIVLIFDETITGFRLSLGGAGELFGVIPDLATFGKGMANGMPLSAVVGNNKIMAKMEDIFFSGTFGGETLSLAAANTVIDKYQKCSIIKHLKTMGGKLLTELDTIIEKHNAHAIFSTSGHPAWSFLHIKATQKYNSFRIKTLFLQEMFKRGILTLGTHNISYAHSQKDIDKLLQIYDEVIPIIINAIDNQTLLEQLNCKPLKPLFKVR